MDAANAVLVVLSFLLLAIVIFAVDSALESRNLRAVRIVRCPATEHPAAVRLEGFRTAIRTALGMQAEMTIDDCSRWPRAARCAQGCRAEIEQKARSTRLDVLEANWESEAVCSRCGARLRRPRLFRRDVFLISPSGTVFEWRELPDDWLAEALASWDALCARCAAAERTEEPVESG